MNHHLENAIRQAEYFAIAGESVRAKMFASFNSNIDRAAKAVDLEKREHLEYGREAYNAATMASAEKAGASIADAIQSLKLAR